MSGGSADGPTPARVALPRSQSLRSTLLGALCLGAAVLGVVQLAVRSAPTDAELAAIVSALPDTVTARRALHALVARETQRNRPIEALDDVIPRLAPADRLFLAQFRPDLLRRGGGEPR